MRNLVNVGSRRSGPVRLCSTWLRWLSIACLCCAAHSARADQQTVYVFTAENGDDVTGVLAANDGTIFATTRVGGRSNLGAVLQVDRRGGIRVLHAFSGADGAAPSGGVILADGGLLYGTTTAGGSTGYGTAFRLTREGELETLHAFTLAEGGPVRAPLLRALDGNFYAAAGGESKVVSHSDGPPTFELNRGAILRMTPAGVVSVLHAFPDGGDAMQPRTGLIQGSDGKLYGSTSAVRDESAVHPFNLSWGNVFQLGLLGDYVTLHAFEPSSDTGNPVGQLFEAANGDLLGATSGSVVWGHTSPGVAFRVSKLGEYSVLRVFEVGGPAGSVPTGLLPGNDGNFYGTTTLDATHNAGALFRLAPDGVTHVLHEFSAAQGSPTTPLVATGPGSFVGATRSQIFRATQTGQLRALANLGGYRQGSQVSTGLSRGRDGSFYGATSAGAAANGGSVYRFSPGRGLRVLHSFPSQVLPHSITPARNSLLYGTTLHGGKGQGSVFRVSANGAFRELYAFDVPDVWSVFPSALVQASDGSFYGSTEAGGALGKGTLFRLDQSGRLVTLHEFGAAAEGGGAPTGGVIEGSDGNFYGTTSYTSQYGGSIFKLNPSGELTTLYLLSTLDDGAGPGTLTLAADGDFYGTTQFGGPTAEGSVFRVSPSGRFTTLHRFGANADLEGETPEPTLLRARDGSLYGSTAFGGALGHGTVFRIAPDGSFATVHSFETERVYGASQLAEAADGTLYALGRDASHADVIVQLQLEAAVAAAQAQLMAAVFPAL